MSEPKIKTPLPETISGNISGLIDGSQVSANVGDILLNVAREHGFRIPTLCYHPGLTSDGNCRLCLVEVNDRLVSSCLYPLRTPGFEVKTNSPRLKRSRELVITLMLSRAPKSKVVLSLAEEFNLKPDPRLARTKEDQCLRCGLCVRACQAGGAEAISLVGRGSERKVCGPFFEPPIDCVGCLACAKVCPTSVIDFIEQRDYRAIWERHFPLVSCPICSRPFATQEELARPNADQICPSCRRRAMAQALYDVDYLRR
ncbi:MAG: (2Fe-2S)-binding protein [Deltaproteobacteria bacterium]|nr:(2Fe-2S)-binding protein [Deltaproteobacteria bacterium]